LCDLFVEKVHDDIPARHHPLNFIFRQIGFGFAGKLVGVGSLVVAIFIVPLLPESAARALDDVSPTWPTEGDYGPDP